MIKKLSIISILSACVLMLSACLLFGCVPSANNQGNTEQQQNRAYMSQVNEIVLETNGELDAFVDAVASGDIVNMKTTANNALKTLSKLSSLEAPSALKDIQEDYKSGSEKLSDALNQYVDLYASAHSDSSDHAISAEAIAKIQALYDEGIADLKAGDEAAAAL